MLLCEDIIDKAGLGTHKFAYVIEYYDENDKVITSIGDTLINHRNMLHSCHFILGNTKYKIGL